MPNISFRSTTTMLSVRSFPKVLMKYSVPVQSGFTVIEPVYKISGKKKETQSRKIEFSANIAMSVDIYGSNGRNGESR